MVGMWLILCALWKMRENRKFEGEIAIDDFFGSHNEEKTVKFSKQRLALCEIIFRYFKFSAKYLGT